MELIDTHAHLDDEQLAPDSDSVLVRARAAGVVAIVAVGTTFETSRQAVQLAGKHAIVRAAVGIHPNYAALAGAGDWRAVVELSREPGVVAVGETGLDRFRSDTPFDQQVDHFERHLGLAGERALPVIIHCRDAEQDVLRCLTAAAGAGPLRGVMHSFSGQAATAARCVELGLYISFAGQLTFKNRKFDALREVARLVPLDRLLIETDSPYLAPEPHRGARNEPAHVRFTAERLAELRGMTPTDLAAATASNARKLFGCEMVNESR
jgi:TatD DNase family protein